MTTPPQTADARITALEATVRELRESKENSSRQLKTLWGVVVGLAALKVLTYLGLIGSGIVKCSMLDVSADGKTHVLSALPADIATGHDASVVEIGADFVGIGDQEGGPQGVTGLGSPWVVIGRLSGPHTVITCADSAVAKPVQTLPALPNYNGEPLPEYYLHNSPAVPIPSSQ